MLVDWKAEQDEMKEIRLAIGNVGSFTIQSQRDNLVKHIRDLERCLKDQRQEYQRRLGRNDKRLGRRLTEEGREAMISLARVVSPGSSPPLADLI